MLARIRHLTALGHCQELALQTQYDQIQALADQIRQLQASRELQDRRIEQVTAQMSYLPGSVNTLVGELRQRLDHLSAPAGTPAKP
jgi:peptidoglycan hydrolase CwlO-like protein